MIPRENFHQNKDFSKWELADLLWREAWKECDTRVQIRGKEEAGLSLMAELLDDGEAVRISQSAEK